MRSVKPNTNYRISYGIELSSNTKIQVLKQTSDGGAWTEIASANSGTVLEFTTPSSWYALGVRLNLTNANRVISLTLKPLLTLATDTDPTYQPYAATNQELTGLIPNTFENGAVNMVYPSYVSQTKNNLTFTVNSDKSITVNGTANADGSLNIVASADNEYLEKGTYKLTGCPIEGSSSSFYIKILDTNAEIGNDKGDGVVFTLTTKTQILLQLKYKNGYVFNNVIFKPMITVADMPNSDYNHYVPYAKSNKELTDDISGCYVASGPAETLTYTPSSSETWKAKFVGVLGLLNSYKSTLASNERMRITNLTLGSSALLNINPFAYYHSNSTFSLNFMQIYAEGSTLVYRGVHVENTESNCKFYKSVTNISSGTTTSTNESSTSSTTSVSVRVEKYKVLS